jgi:hypothetical protein
MVSLIKSRNPIIVSKFKKSLILIFFFSINLFVYPQNESNEKDISAIEHPGNRFIFSVSPDVLLNTPNGNQFAAGIKAQIFINEKFSFDADMVFSRDYFHFSASAIGISLFLIGTSISSGSWFPLATMLLALSAEHISYHFRFNENLDIAPYLSFLRYKFSYRHDDPSNPEFAGKQYGFAAGLQINKYIGRFVLSPYGEYNLGYKDHISGFNTGIYFGILLPHK